ncbi:MAG: DEAD/DEAH box helicase [Treponema sp.]|jgi:superfamily II DNA/RNA helicase|nr:DEAD/DEAH box helicase [Treponema sp.]
MDTFDALGVQPSLTEKLKERYIIKPTVIQKIVIPGLLAGKSIIFRSATGTGKTLAYLLPLLQNVKTDSPGVAVLIIAPTLELCSQIKNEISLLSASPCALLTGSVNPDKQVNSLVKNKPRIAVGNPGRLLALVKTGKLQFNNLSFLVLDEANKLTASECIDETRQLLSLIEKGIHGQNLQISACSATVNAKTRDKLGSLFRTAEIIESDDHEILRGRIEHWAVYSEKRKNVDTLRSLLATIKAKKKRFKALVFTSRNDTAGLVLNKLQFHHIAASGLFSKAEGKPLSSGERKAALDNFRSGKISVLVSTDLAACGLDIHGLSYIIALDVNEDSDVYIHRCGRTARAGKHGIMITIGDEHALRRLASIEKKLKIVVHPKELSYGQIKDIK